VPQNKKVFKCNLKVALKIQILYRRLQMKLNFLLLVLCLLFLPMVLFSEGIWDSAYKADFSGLSNYIENVGVAVDSPDSKLGYSPLMYAIIGITQVRGGGYSAGDFDPTSCTEYIDIIDYLISKGADVNKLGFDNTSPLFYSVSYGFYNITEILLNHGSKINLKFPKSSEILGINDFPRLYNQYYYSIYNKGAKKDNFNLLDYSIYLFSQLQSEELRPMTINAAKTVRLIYDNNKIQKSKMDFVYPDSLNFAIIFGDFDKVKILVKQGQSPSTSSFFYANEMGDTNIFEYLNKYFKQ
jgi:hypothetical protein